MIQDGKGNVMIQDGKGNVLWIQTLILSIKQFVCLHRWDGFPITESCQKCQKLRKKKL